MSAPRLCVLRRDEIVPKGQRGFGLMRGDKVWIHSLTAAYAVFSLELGGPRGLIDIRCLRPADRQPAPGDQPVLGGGV